MYCIWSLAGISLLITASFEGLQLCGEKWSLADPLMEEETDDSLWVKPTENTVSRNRAIKRERENKIQRREKKSHVQGGTDVKFGHRW